ncbi:hypothetical protein ACFFIX_21980 [Metabacillus herbersteinensis]|uniref:Uncharacterized protein n=1 Tax=Metabacillus herbersteinensis TaxID=283816 RepID=A0ABV6GKT0_9BACI
MTIKEYEKELESHLEALQTKLKGKTFRAKPVRRKYVRICEPLVEGKGVRGDAEYFIFHFL